MKRKTISRILRWTAITFILLVGVLAVHIYAATRPGKPNEHTVAIARIDIKQPVDQADAGKITNWLYQQEGVDKVLCNTDSKIVVFSYHPVKANPDQIIKRFKSDLAYKADRFMPSADQMKSGCPVASTSVSFKLYSYIKNMF